MHTYTRTHACGICLQVCLHMVWIHAHLHAHVAHACAHDAPLCCAQVDMSRALMVSVLWAIASVRIVGGCLATSLVIYLFASLLTYVARLMVIACACVRETCVLSCVGGWVGGCVRACVCLRVCVRRSVFFICVCECRESGWVWAWTFPAQCAGARRTAA